MIIQMKKDFWIYQYSYSKEDFPSIIHPLKINDVLSNKDVIEDIKLLIYNNKFTINEIFDINLLQIIYDENNKKIIYLQLLNDNKDNLETKSNKELLEEINELKNELKNSIIGNSEILGLDFLKIFLDDENKEKIIF